MAYCPQCGKESEQGRFCASCGTPLAADAVAAAAATSRRWRREMWLTAAALGLVMVVCSVVVVSRLQHAAAPEASGAAARRETAPAARPGETPGATPNDTPSLTAIDNRADAPQPAQAAASPVSAGGRDAAPRALIDGSAFSGDSAGAARALPHEGENEEELPGSERYPGSQPVTVENANLPDIGVPVTSEVYSTPDPLPTVLSYYRQRYPDAQVSNVNGQTVLAIDRPGRAMVIALGTAGSETRIALVEPDMVRPNMVQPNMVQPK